MTSVTIILLIWVLLGIECLYNIIVCTREQEKMFQELREENEHTRAVLEHAEEEYKR